MKAAFAIEGRPIGGTRAFVIAEAGVNHNGDVELARKLVDAAAEAGADAVKFQTFDPAKLASSTAEKAAYQAERDDAPTQQAMLEKLVLPTAALAELRDRARALGIVFLSSPFDEGSVDLLATLDVPAFKIPSGEITNLPFLRHVASKGKPVLLSSGMCTLADVDLAIHTLRRVPTLPIALFHCVSSYPAPPDVCNLHAMATMRRAFDAPTGWSDHTLGIDITLAAIALGAELIEKHLTLDRSMPGPDHEASIEPGEFAEMVRSLRRIESARGDGIKRPATIETAIAAVARKSLHWTADAAAGKRIVVGDVIALRPGSGVAPSVEVEGRVLRRAVRAGTMLSLEDLEPA